MALKRALARPSIRRGVRIVALSIWLVGAACTEPGDPGATAAAPTRPAPARAIVVSGGGASSPSSALIAETRPVAVAAPRGATKGAEQAGPAGAGAGRAV